jgi:glutamate synthase domain-containing protein 2/glutamate synthase domain-containing protein 1/glutamate synthase domain-containing protein 3
MRHSKQIQKLGLYDARFEHDNCGVGLVADIVGRRSFRILRQAITGLVNLTHRGAVSADGLTGDGAGILTNLPHGLIQRELRCRGIDVAEAGDLAVGMVFIPNCPDDAEPICVEIINREIDHCDMKVLMWRDVPTNTAVLGKRGLETCPVIRQVIVRRNESLEASQFERALYRARKRIERAVAITSVESIHIASLSSRTIVYKGLMVAGQLDSFYPDLLDPEYETAIALFHQRFSTNTNPSWERAQPLRYLGHNGEINTLRGNINRFNAGARQMSSQVWGEQLADLHPIIEPYGSDSSALDNVLELLINSGRDPLHAMLMLMPEAYQQMETMQEDIGAFFEFHASLMAPWDGPAAVTFTDGVVAGAMLDRNGLRPLRYWVTKDGTLIAGSETGIVPVDDGQVVKSSRLGPGRMIAVDTAAGRLLLDDEIKRHIATRRPYRRWVVGKMIKPYAEREEASAESAALDIDDLTRVQKAFAYGKEDIDRLLIPMIYEGKEPVGSMGNDTPIAVLSHFPKTVYRYFKQLFAQVTNPPIDPLRERLVMSLRTAVGGRAGVLDEDERAAELIKFASPVIDGAQFEWLKSLSNDRFRAQTLSCHFDIAGGPEGFEPALDALCFAAERAIDEGAPLIVLSDRRINADRAPIPMLLATSAVHQHLIRVGKRTQSSLICDTGDPRMDHHFACLLGFGASLVHPYVGLASVREWVRRDPRGQGITLTDALQNYRNAVNNGLLKIMSKMGISTISSYRGAQNFEAVGIANSVIDRYFTGTASRIGGVGLHEIAVDVLRFHAEAFGDDPDLADRGIYAYRKKGEYHSTNPIITKTLHRAVRTRDAQAFAQYTSLVDERPVCNLRDLIDWKRSDKPIPLEEVEPAESIVKRFCTQAMSHGAVSREAHEVLSIAMNRIGAKSNSGEGGEHRERFYRYSDTRADRSLARWHPQADDWGNSQIKQVASGRFGVTPEYLVSAREIEIKMAQGSKPGEGGQILGDKVTEEISNLRRAMLGAPLISPPPHHDIYSIEDLGQLIFDLKRVNQKARVGVKLVSVAGVGTIAAGVAKAYADFIQVSGHDGGTGASPLSSIKNAGLPWELGLAEVQQVLVLNDLRGRVTVRVDGGLKTGRDVIIAALLGADEFGFGTTALVAAGCVMVRQCHLNNCPVGIATQRPELRAKFPGEPDHVIALMMFLAEQVRMDLAEMGVRRLDQIIGRFEWLKQREGLALPKTNNIDLSAMLTDPDPSGSKARRCLLPFNDATEHEIQLDEQVLRDCRSAIVDTACIVKGYQITNRDRSVGARLSGEIARYHRDVGLPNDSIRLHFTGVAGQSFGAFCNKGMQLMLDGEAQDYVGKSMYGGRIVIRVRGFQSEPPVLMGNTVMYGATGGELFAAGLSGERLCVRNSGGRVVVEGCGDHGCEYMTNGVVVVLGGVGRNFGAGMTGGIAFVLDEVSRVKSMVNRRDVDVRPLASDLERAVVLAMIRRHFELTGSTRAAKVLDNSQESLRQFLTVTPLIVNESWVEKQRQVLESVLAELNDFRQATPAV